MSSTKSKHDDQLQPTLGCHIPHKEEGCPCLQFNFPGSSLWFYFDLKCEGSGQMTVGSKKLTNSTTEAPIAGYHTFLLSTELHWSEWNPDYKSFSARQGINTSKAELGRVPSEHSLNQSWISNLAGHCFLQCIPALSHTDSLTLDGEFPDLLQR